MHDGTYFHDLQMLNACVTLGCYSNHRAIKLGHPTPDRNNSFLVKLSIFNSRQAYNQIPPDENRWKQEKKIIAVAISIFFSLQIGSDMEKPNLNMDIMRKWTNTKRELKNMLRSHDLIFSSMHV
jgi:hypothetical protein